MIHYPLNTIHEIQKTKMDTFEGWLGNCGQVMKAGFIGFSLLNLRPTDYAMIAETWETAMINEFQRMQNEQFRQMYGEEY